MDGLEFVWAGTVPYAEAWQWQRELHARRVAGEVPDRVLLLEHPSVYTAGRRTEAWARPTDGTPVVEVDRGGQITWHGPGQLVGYPVVAVPTLPGVPGLRDAVVDVVGHVRRIEAALIEVCAAFEVPAARVPGRSGVWTADGARKLAAIGVRVSRGVAMHGFALNCDPSLTPYDAIVACGIRDAGVTTLTLERGGKTVTVADALPVVETALRHVLTPEPARV